MNWQRRIYDDPSGTRREFTIREIGPMWSLKILRVRQPDKFIVELFDEESTARDFGEALADALNMTEIKDAA
jgi:hypothetical protein